MNAELIMTVEQMEQEENWLKARKMGIGGSDASAVVGFNRYRTPREVYEEKIAEVEKIDDKQDNPYIYWGHAMEPLIAEWFTKKTGKKVRRAGLMRSKEYPFMLASVDRLVIGEKAGLEIKTASGFKAKEWEASEVPNEYYIQCQHYMAVTGLDKWYIAVLIGGNNAIWKEIPRNEEDIKALIAAEKNFWNMVTNRIPPEYGTEEKLKALEERHKGGNKEPLIIDQEETVDSAKRYLAIKEQIDGLKDELKIYEVALKEQLGDHEMGLAGNYKIDWSTVAGRSSIDSKRLKAENEEIYKKYVKISAPTRRFKVSFLD